MLAQPGTTASSLVVAAKAAQSVPNPPTPSDSKDKQAPKRGAASSTLAMENVLDLTVAYIIADGAAGYGLALLFVDADSRLSVDKLV